MSNTERQVRVAAGTDQGEEAIEGNEQDHAAYGFVFGEEHFCLKNECD